MALSNNESHERGFLLIDVLIGLFVASILTAAFLGSVVAAVRYASMQTKAVQAELLAIEMVEVARELEKSPGGWNELTSGACDTACHPEVSGGIWNLVGGAETIDAFTRSMVVEDVTRDASFAIADAGAVDSNSRKVLGTVAWSAFGESRSLTLETYVYER